MRYFTLIIFIVLTVGFASLYTLPLWHQAQALSTTIAIGNDRLATADSLGKSRADLIGKYNSIPKADLDNLITLLPDNVHNIRLIIQIDSLATKNGLSVLQNVSYATHDTTTDDPKAVAKANQTKPPYEPFTISFDTIGTYKNFLSFVSDLEKNLRLLDVTQVDFTPVPSQNPKDAPNANGLISYKVKITTYWLRQ
jgi:hypothetical protein